MIISRYLAWTGYSQIHCRWLRQNAILQSPKFRNTYRFGRHQPYGMWSRIKIDDILFIWPMLCLCRSMKTIIMQVSKFESLNVNCPSNNLPSKDPKRCGCFWTCQKQEGRREAKEQGKGERRRKRPQEAENGWAWRDWALEEMSTILVWCRKQPKLSLIQAGSSFIQNSIAGQLTLEVRSLEKNWVTRIWAKLSPNPNANKEVYRF